MEAKRDQNFVPTLLAVSSVDGITPVTLYADPVTHRLLVDLAVGSGTVTDVSVVTANGFAGTVANSTTTPAITIETTVTGIIKGDGTAISAATPGTDYTSLAFKTISVAGQSDVVADTPEDTVTFVGSGITITTNAGTDTVTFTVDSTGFANRALSNLLNVAINTTLVSDTDATDDLGTTSIRWNNIFGVNLGSTAVRFTTGWFTDLTVTNPISGSITGTAAVATTVTVANEATDTSCFVTFVTDATGNLGVKTNANMTFNSNTGVVTFASSVLTTTDINGGTIDATVIGGASAAAGTFTTLVATTINGNTFTTGTGVLTIAAAKTLTVSNTLTLAGTDGKGIDVGAATSGKILIGDGTNMILSTPTFPNVSATTRKIIVSDGTNWVASTETYAVPGTTGNVMTSDGTNWTSVASPVPSFNNFFGALNPTYTKTYANMYFPFVIAIGSALNSLTTDVVWWLRSDTSECQVFTGGQLAGFTSGSTARSFWLVPGFFNTTVGTNLTFASTNIVVFDCWARFPTLGADVKFGFFDSETTMQTAYTDTSGERQICFAIDNTGPQLYAVTTNNTSGTTTSLSGVTVTNWNNYRIVADLNADSVDFYVNGVLKTTIATTVPDANGIYPGFGRQTGTTTGLFTAPFISVSLA